MTETELSLRRLDVINSNVKETEKELLSGASIQTLLFRLVKAVSYVAAELVLTNTPRSK